MRISAVYLYLVLSFVQDAIRSAAIKKQALWQLKPPSFAKLFKEFYRNMPHFKHDLDLTFKLGDKLI